LEDEDEEGEAELSMAMGVLRVSFSLAFGLGALTEESLEDAESAEDLEVELPMATLCCFDRSWEMSKVSRGLQERAAPMAC
jgi:hypothetical protein